MSPDNGRDTPMNIITSTRISSILTQAKQFVNIGIPIL